jgi:tRNA1(Val) A37 N6-methylase TrmN6
MPAERREPDVTDDAVLGGRLHLLQPRRGHRFGHDAILLAAATPARDGERATDLGAGVGTAGLALAARMAGVRVSLVEISPGLASLAAMNIARNALAERVSAVALDVAALPAAFARAGLGRASCDAVLTNPPFNDPDRHRASPDTHRDQAHALPRDALARWVATAARLLRPGGTLTVIFRADGAAGLLAALDRDFGAIAVMPVHPKPDASAIRVLVGAVKASRAPLAIRPGLVLAAHDGTPSPQAEAVLRHAAALPLFA